MAISFPATQTGSRDGRDREITRADTRSRQTIYNIHVHGPHQRRYCLFSVSKCTETDLKMSYICFFRCSNGLNGTSMDTSVLAEH